MLEKMTGRYLSLGYLSCLDAVGLNEGSRIKLFPFPPVPAGCWY